MTQCLAHALAAHALAAHALVAHGSGRQLMGN